MKKMMIFVSSMFILNLVGINKISCSWQHKYGHQKRANQLFLGTIFRKKIPFDHKSAFIRCQKGEKFFDSSDKYRKERFARLKERLQGVVVMSESSGG